MWYTSLNWCRVSEYSVCFASVDIVCNEFLDGVWHVYLVYFCVSECMLNVSNCLLMCCAIVSVRSAGSF